MVNDVHVSRSPEETRGRILAATRQLFAKKGRRGTTTREVAELAGVNEATLFRHFGNKDALIEACAEHYCAAAQLQELLPQLSGKLEDDLRQIGRAIRERMDEVRDMIIMSLSDEENDSTVGLAAWRGPQAVRQLLSEYMARRVEAGELAGDPQLLARFFMGMIFAQVIGRKKLPELAYSPEQILDFQIDVFLNGVRK
ncbi:MAG TPA: TetR/AcrR family transcriptional regulator [Candidatus Baltobacteraceae bacterium]|jgi:AcrR family transcriptional regulator|nr:TetR/AcrR family transcriptional regulator [Candidatus Baltobacteraceae bacterium]